MIRVGFSEVNITPALGTRMSGMLNPPPAQGVEWPLYARTVVFDDGIGRLAIVSLDLLYLQAHTVAEYRVALAAANEIEAAAILIACSHTHRGPYTAFGMDEEANFAYLDTLRVWLVRALAIGDVALVSFPVELFCEFGLIIKERSPLADTFVVTLANGGLGYVPTLEAFAHGGYEPRLAGHSHLIPEAGDLITAAALRLLREIASFTA
jgi:hypothetical protein